MKKNLHMGHHLHQIVKKSGVKLDRLVKEMGFSGYPSVHYYYNKSEIKEATLTKFLSILNVSRDEFFNVGMVNEPVATYNISKHQGLNLKTILEQKGISITAFCSQLNISRPTLYSYFEQKEIPLGFLLEAANVLEIKAARIKGYGETEKSFEKEIYEELKEIKKLIQK